MWEPLSGDLKQISAFLTNPAAYIVHQTLANLPVVIAYVWGFVTAVVIVFVLGRISAWPGRLMPALFQTPGSTIARSVHFFFTLPLAGVVVFVVIFGLKSHLSFNDWLFLDGVIAAAFILMSIGMAIRHAPTLFALLFGFPEAEIIAFASHAQQPMWIALDLAAVAVSVSAVVRAWPAFE